MSHLPLAAQYFIYLIIAIVVINAMGKAVLSYLIRYELAIEQRYFRLFLQLVVGLTIVVIAAALYFTRGLTINLIFILLGLLWLGLRPRVNAACMSSAVADDLFESRSIWWNDYALLLAGGAAIFGFKSLFTFIGSSSLGVPHSDYLYYANVANQIAKYGIETLQLEYIYPRAVSVFPYHYFQLWLNAGFVTLFKSNSLLSLLLITYSLGALTVWVGFCALYEHFGRVNAKAVLLCLALLFFSGLFMWEAGGNWLFKGNEIYAANVLNHYKTFPAFIFLLLGLLFFLKADATKACYALLCLPIVNVATAPAVLSAVFLYSLFLYFVNKNRKEAVAIGSASVAVGISFLLFYTLLSKSSATYTNNPAYHRTLAGYAKTFANIIVGAVIKVGASYMLNVLLLVVIFSWRDARKLIINNSYLLLLPAIVFLSLLSWAVLHPLIDAVQFFTNVSMPILSIFFVATFFWTINNASFAKRLATIVVFFLILSINVAFTIDRIKPQRVYSRRYLEYVKSKTYDGNHLGAYLKGGKDYSSVYSYKSNLDVPGGYLEFIGSDYFPVSLSVFDAAYDPATHQLQEEKLDKTSSFYKFVDLQTKAGYFKSYAQSQLDFIEQYHISYVVVSQNAIVPPLLQKWITEEIKDSVSGDKIIILKRK